jgi:hypothetical protein
MRRSIVRATGVAALIAAWVVASAAVAGTPFERPRPVYVTSGGHHVKAAQGSFCIFYPAQAACGDYFYPLRVHGRLAVSPRHHLLIRTHDRRIQRVGVALLHARGHNVRFGDWSAKAHRVREHPARFRVRLPRDLGNANRLDIFARYERGGGDSDWWLGLKRHR